MSSNETPTALEAMSAAIRATTKLTNDAKESEGLTPAMLASAIKLASLTNSHQEQLTSATVNAAIKLTKKTSEQDDNLTPESLAAALKLATKASLNQNDDNEDTDGTSADQMLAAMRAAVAMTQDNPTNELVTPELLSHALKLAKE